MPVGENAESRARDAINAQDPKAGQEMQQVQALQSSIQEIQGERNQNLMAAKVGAEGDARENAAMLQAAEMATLGGVAGAGGVAAIENATPVQQTSPQTQALLSKYGVGKPKNQRVSTRNVQVTPQKITINNNTTNNTTNNVAIPPANVGGPVQGRTLAVKQQPDQSQARFKTWISNAFARQNQAAQAREKEYQRREWSLSRTTGKLMKKLQELGTTISERMDPRKMASSVGGHLKTLLFLFGTTFLAANWKRVIRIGANIERFFFGEPDPKNPEGKRGEPGWKKLVKNLFGAKEGETVGDAIKHFFWNDEKNGAFDMLLDKFKNFFKERADAAKAIKFPDIDLKDIPGTLKGIAGYLGDILKALVGGADAVKDNIGNSINRISLQREKDFGYQNNIGYKVENSVGFGSNTSYGDKVLTEAKDGKTAVHLLPGSVDFDGRLVDKASASISQSNSLAHSSYNNAKHGYYDVAKVSAGLSRLNESIEDKGKVPVSEEFLKEYLTADQIKSLKDSKNISYGRFKYWKREKTKDELAREGAGDFLETAGTSYILDEATGGNRFGVKAGKAIMTGDADYLLGDEAMALKRGAVAKVNQWLADKYTYELVPLDAKVPGEKNEDGAIITYNFPVIDKTVINTIRKNIGGEGTTFDLGDKDYTSSVQKYLEGKYDGGPRIAILDPETGEAVKSPYDMDIEGIYKELDNIKKEADKRDKELDKKYESSPVKRSVDNIKAGVSSAVEGVKGYFYSGDDKQGASKSQQAAFIQKMRDAYSKKFKELGLDEKYIDALVAQDAYESTWGTSDLTKQNNYGGIRNGNKGWQSFDSLDDYIDYKVNLLNSDKYKAFSGDVNSMINRVSEIYAPASDGNKDYSGNWTTMFNQVQGLKPLSTDEIKALRNQGRWAEADMASASWERIEDVLTKGGVTGFKVTSKKREPGEAGNSGNKSYHTTDNLAIDIVPIEGQTFEGLKQQILASPLIQKYFADRKLGVLDETSKEMLEKTGGTGPHFHIGPDNSSVQGWLAWNKEEKVTPDNYVEEKALDDTYLAGFDWQKSGGDNSALNMAQADIPKVIVNSRKPITSGVNGSSSVSYTEKAAKDVSGTSNSNANLELLITSTNSKLDKLTTLLAQASDQQVQATLTVAQGLGNMSITVNNQPNPVQPTQEWSMVNYLPNQS